MWFAHQYFVLALVALAAVCVSTFQPVGLSQPTRDVIRVSVTVSLWLALMGARATLWHAERVCLPCATRFPLDGSRQAERRRRTLAASHALNNAPLLAVVAVVSIATAWTAWSTWVSLAAHVLLAAGACAAHAHMPLQLWCRWCGWDDDGDDDDDGDGPPPSNPVRVAHLLGKENRA
jgi:hypothetical protein